MTAMVLAVSALACRGAGTPAAAETRAALPPLPAWRSARDRAHPLVGRIWSVRAARFVDERDVRAQLRGFVLLGEKHDNPDHHALQARLLAAMIEDGRRPAVAFEMLDEDAQPRVDAARREAPRDPAAIARAVAWDRSGWPPFEDYAPILETALRADLAIVATGIPPARARAMVKANAPAPGALEPAPLDEASTSTLREELRASHCGQLPDGMVAGMARVQRARDATMAAALIRASASDSDSDSDSGLTDAVLVAGTGHTRRDRGVPLDLAARAPARAVVSVAFVEVVASASSPLAYGQAWHVPAGKLPFDFVWFTPRATDEDPCAALQSSYSDPSLR